MARRMKGEAAHGVEVAVTPMLDMTFQLLFFFLLNYHPSALEGQMNMALPSDKQEAKADKLENVTTGSDEKDDTLPADLTVQIKTQNSNDASEEDRGKISQLILVGRDGPKEVPTSPTGDELGPLLKELQAAREGGNLTNKEDIKIQADSRLRWTYVVKVMDVCTKAGFKPGFAAPPDRGVGQQ
jgi:biopolymer transport protein ExbD